jgi:hypothetical protein
MTLKELKAIKEFVEWIDINYFSYDKLEKDTLLKKLLDIYIDKKTIIKNL